MWNSRPRLFLLRAARLDCSTLPRSFSRKTCGYLFVAFQESQDLIAKKSLYFFTDEGAKHEFLNPQPALPSTFAK